MKFRCIEHAVNEGLIQQRWPEFEELVPDDEVGLEIVFRALSMLGLVRCKCGSQAVVREERSRTFSCGDCHAKVWFTAGTLFYRVKQFKAWLGAIWLMENGIAVASSRLAQLAGIAQATAHNILKKIRLLVEDCFEAEAPSISSTLFISIMTKRSRSSLPNAHPDAELRTMSAENQPADCFSRSEFEPREDVDSGFASDSERAPSAPDPSSSMEENEQRVFDYISYTPISFDSLCELTGLSVGIVSAALVMLELSGRINCLDGDFFVRSKSSTASTSERSEILTAEALALIAAVHRLIWSFHHGVSFKWLQSFLAMIWFFFDKVRWTRGTLLVACLKSGPIDVNGRGAFCPSRLVVFPSMLRTVAN